MRFMNMARLVTLCASESRRSATKLMSSFCCYWSAWSSCLMISW